MTAPRLADAIGRGLAALCALILAVLLALVAGATLLRYLFNTGLPGSAEAASWLLLLLVATGLPLSAQGVLALRFDLFGKRAFPRLRDAIAQAVIALAFLVLAQAGIEAARGIGGTSALLGLPEGLRPAVLAAGGILGLLLTGLRLNGGRALAIVAGMGGLYLLGQVDLPGGPAPALVLALSAGAAVLAGAPLPHALIAGVWLAQPFGSPLAAPALGAVLAAGMERHLLLAIPFFLLAGGLLSWSGMAQDLVRFARALAGRHRAGLGQTVLLTSVMFSGTSGSSIANAAFGAKTFVPELTAQGMAPERAGALVAATSVLDNIIPPSIAFLLLAAATGLPVGPLLAGGLVAGLGLALALAVAIQLTVHTTPAPLPELPHKGRAALRALPVFGLGLVVVLGIRLGLATPTEAASLAAAYTLGAALLRGARPASAFRQAGLETAAILFLIGASAPVAMILAVDGIAARVVNLAGAFGNHPLAVLLAINLLLLMIGLVLDIGAAILLFAPLTLPVAVAAGVDPVVFGVILVVNLMIGGLTPPLGILVQVTAASAGLSAPRLFHAVLPYLAALLAALLVMSLGAALL